MMMCVHFQDWLSLCFQDYLCTPANALVSIWRASVYMCVYICVRIASTVKGWYLAVDFVTDEYICNSYLIKNSPKLSVGKCSVATLKINLANKPQLVVSVLGRFRHFYHKYITVPQPFHTCNSNTYIERLYLFWNRVVRVVQLGL